MNRADSRAGQRQQQRAIVGDAAEDTDDGLLPDARLKPRADPGGAREPFGANRRKAVIPPPAANIGEGGPERGYHIGDRWRGDPGSHDRGSRAFSRVGVTGKVDAETDHGCPVHPFKEDARNFDAVEQNVVRPFDRKPIGCDPAIEGAGKRDRRDER